MAGTCSLVLLLLRLYQTAGLYSHKGTYLFYQHNQVLSRGHCHKILSIFDKRIENGIPSRINCLHVYIESCIRAYIISCTWSSYMCTCMFSGSWKCRHMYSVITWHYVFIDLVDYVHLSRT